jgi:hypothetical protein
VGDGEENGETSQEWAALETAIEALYQTFAIYPLRPVIDGCPHCVSREDSDQLHVRPLRELAPDDVRYYAFKAMTTFGDAADFKHFLPRLLELIARELRGSETLGLNEEVVGEKIALAQYSTWPRAERAAVEGFFMATWRVTLATFPSMPEPQTLLCTVAQFTGADGLAPYLATWRKTLLPLALFHVVGTIFSGYRSTWWPAAAWARFDAWLQDDDTATMLGLAALELRAGNYVGQFSPDIEMALAGFAAD